MYSRVILSISLAGLAATAFAAAGKPPEKTPPPRAVVPAAVAATTTAYELAGFFGAGATLEVSLVKKADGKAVWIRVGETSGELRVESADAKKGTALVRIGDTRYRLHLRAAKPAEALPPEAKPTPAPADDSPERRRELRKAWKEFEATLSSEQKELGGKLMEARFRELEKSHPDLLKGDPSPETINLLMPSIRDTLGEMMKLPGKDGIVRPAPDNWEAMIRAEMDREPPASAQPATPPPA